MKLNIGAGKTDLPGFEPWDIQQGKMAYPLDLPDDSVEEIYASHVLEHFSHRLSLKVLQEWVRALKPGGTIRVAVPDFTFCANAYLEQRPDVNVEGYVMGGHIDDDDVHAALFSREKLTKLMEAAGLQNVREWRAVINDCAALPVSLNLQADKPGGEMGPEPKVVAIWSVPRLGFMDNFHCMFETLPRLGIPLIRGMGVFWGQQMECIAERAMDEHQADALLTLDYDSVYTLEDVRQLISLFRRHPEADAICAHQWNRAADQPLWSPPEAEDGSRVETSVSELLADDLYELGTGHFGLTMLRVSSLKKLSHPWFLASPNGDGEWKDGKTDADIHFWQHLRRSGFRAFLAPRIVIGHLELSVRWPGQNLSVIHQHMYDYHAAGRPDAAFGGTR